MAIQKPTQDGSDTMRWIIIAGLVVVAFFGAYKFASARTAQASSILPASAAAQSSGTQAPGGGSTAAGSGSCCGGGSAASSAGGVTGKPIEGVAAVQGGVQKIDVKVTTTYDPNVLKLKAGIPAEITFSGAQGCTGYVQSQDLGFQEDLTTGPKTVKLQDLKPGTYSFSCGMNMVFGKIVVE